VSSPTPFSTPSLPTTISTPPSATIRARLTLWSALAVAMNVAMNINTGTTPLVLPCPAWKTWGTATEAKPGTLILHSRADDVVPFSDSEELVANSNLPPETLSEVGSNHRLADDDSLGTMVKAVEMTRNPTQEL
jgi:hypothetical protein